MKSVLRKGSLSAAVGMALCCVLLPAGQAHATTAVPCNDINALKAAITASNTSGESISLAPGCTYTLTAPDNDENGLPVITGNVSIFSPTGTATIRRSPTATQDFRIFEVATGGTLGLTRVTVSGGLLGSDFDDAGGGILNQGTANLTASTVSGNEAGFGGGGIYNNAGRLNLTSSSVDNNKAPGDLGGGIWNDSGTLTMTGGTLRNNTSSSDGGGLENWPDSTASITRTTLSGNVSTEGNGGAIDNDSFSTLKLTSSTVRGNRAETGGGIRNRSSVATLVSTQVTNNIATGGPGSGGGIYKSSGTVTLVGSTVTGNTPDNCAPPGSVPGCTNPFAASGHPAPPESGKFKEKRHAHALRSS